MHTPKQLKKAFCSISEYLMTGVLYSEIHIFYVFFVPSKSYLLTVTLVQSTNATLQSYKNMQLFVCCLAKTFPFIVFLSFETPMRICDLTQIGYCTRKFK